MSDEQAPSAGTDESESNKKPKHVPAAAAAASSSSSSAAAAAAGAAPPAAAADAAAAAPVLCHISLLPAVMVQSIMQFLDARGIVRLAQCSRAIWGHALVPFAWRHAPTLSRTVSEALTRTARLCPMALTLDIPWCTEARRYLQHVLDCNDANIKVLILREGAPNTSSHPSGLLDRFMSSPSVARLHTLVVHSGAPKSIVTHMAALPSLQTLDLHGWQAPLLQMPRGLTSLSLLPYHAKIPTLQVVAQLPALSQLTLRCPTFTDVPGSFRELCTFHRMSTGLRRLGLQFHSAVGEIPPLAELQAGFAALTALELLHISRLECQSELVTALHPPAVPALRLLHLEFKARLEPTVLVDLLNQRVDPFRCELVTYGPCVVQHDRLTLTLKPGQPIHVNPFTQLFDWRGKFPL